MPHGAEVVPIPDDLDSAIDVDYWLIPFNPKLAQRTFPHLRGVRVAQTLTAGVDSVLPWLPAEITLCNARGIHDAPTSEWVLAAILASLKRFPTFHTQQAAHVWKGQAAHSAADRDHNGLYRVLGDDLAEKRVLIVGYGNIGAAIERRLMPFEVEIDRVARTPKTEPQVYGISELGRLLPLADVVVLIVPLTVETTGLVGERELSLMKPGALLVNAARGPVVDTDALVAALYAERIRCATDVTEPEPLPSEHPLWKAPNLLLTPHVGGSTPLFIERVFRLAARQAKHMLDGEPMENVIGERGY